jgi:iron complex outermembrane receptor protein
MRWNLRKSASFGVISAAIAFGANPAWAGAGSDAAAAQSAAGEAGAAAQSTAADGAHADTGGGLEDIVVTAQRRKERLQDVPLAVTALSAQTLATGGVTTTQDLNLKVPGLNFTSVAGFSLPRIRGVGSTSSSAGNENEVATYVDGVYIAASSSALLSFNNISGVAVLKGPQGTLFGRNATGGVIQVTTRDPSQNLSGEAHAKIGNYKTIGGDFYLTGGVASNVAADISLYYNNQMDGFGRNLFSQNDVNKYREFAVRSKIKIDLDEATTVTLSGDYSNARNLIPAYRPVDGSIPFNGRRFTGSTYDINSNVDPYSTNKQGGGSVTISHDFGSVNLLSITAYRKTDFFAAVDSDKTPQAFLDLNLIETDKQFTQEVQLLSKASSRFKWVLGAFYYNAQTDFASRLIFPGVRTIYTAIKQKPESVAGFAQGTYALTDKLNATVGLRYTYEKRLFASGGSVFNAAGALVAPQAGNTASFNTKKLTWRFAVDYHFDKDVLGYISYNRGFKSGGYNSGLAAIPYAGEQLDAYEVGIKGDFLDKTLRVNLGGFYYDYKNIQAISYINSVANIFNAASAKIYGVDADITIAPVRNLTVTLGGSLIHDRFGTFNNAVVSVPLVPNGTTVLGGNSITQGSATGNRLPMTPDWTVNLGVNYIVPLPSGRMIFDANYYHNNGWYGEVDNRLRQKAYNVVNSSITWEVDTNAKLSLSIWGKNLTREVYAYTLVSGATNDAIMLAPPRTFGASVGVKF